MSNTSRETVLFVPARAQDLKALVAFYNEKGGDLLKSGPLASISSHSPHGRFICNENVSCWILCRDVVSEIILAAGLVTLHASARELVGCIDMILVSEEARGRGLARALMEELHAWARARHVRVLRLSSNPQRVAARALYESLGYTLVTGSDRHFALKLSL